VDRIRTPLLCNVVVARRRNDKNTKTKKDFVNEEEKEYLNSRDPDGAIHASALRVEAWRCGRFYGDSVDLAR